METKSNQQKLTMDMQHSNNPLLGMVLLGITGFGKLINELAESGYVQFLASCVSVMAGTLAAIHYSIIIYEKLFKKVK